MTQTEAEDRKMATQKSAATCHAERQWRGNLRMANPEFMISGSLLKE
jgi:hypothetical protein